MKSSKLRMRTFELLLVVALLVSNQPGTMADTATLKPADKYEQMATQAQQLTEQGKPLEAAPLYAELLKIEETEHVLDKFRFATLLTDVGVNHWQTGKYSEAEVAYKRAIQIFEELVAQDSPKQETMAGYVLVLKNLGDVYETTGDYKQGLELYQKALAYGREKLGADHINSIDALEGVGVIYSDEGKSTEAEPYLKETLKLREKGNDPEGLVNTLISLGSLNLDLKDYQLAQVNLERALALQEKAHGKVNPLVADILIQLAMLAEIREQYGEAELLLTRCLQIREKVLGPDHFHTALALNNLAHVYQEQQEYAKAEALYKRAVDVLEKRFGSDARNLNVANVYTCYASLLYRMNQTAAAVNMKAKATAIRARLEE